MNVLGELRPLAVKRSRAWLVGTFAASLVFGPSSMGIAADDARLQQARGAEQRLLGSDDEEARYAACQPFTREITIEGIFEKSFDASLTKAGVPAAVKLEARRALATEIDRGREVAADDRFYVRYEQTFTGEGVPIGVGRVLWAELVTKAKGTLTIHRFRPSDGVEQFWLASGEAATPPSMRLPLDTVAVSSGFGMRADPFDQASRLGTIRKPTPMDGPIRGSGMSAKVSTINLPAWLGTIRKPTPMGGPIRGSGMNAKGSTINLAMARGVASGLPLQPGLASPLRSSHALSMHEGIDLVAPPGTPIYAASDGIVVGAMPNGEYGNWVRIDHPGKLSTVYGHLSEFAPGIRAGVQVRQGELIGFVGNTGRSLGAHLHFEILNTGVAVDPLSFPETKRAQLRGADLERFRKQVKQTLAERETVAALVTSAQIAEADSHDWNLLP
jgi:murein DD-endopeptidase MepM/ murein hydrolase activator NlpD